ncbi:MAG: LodA/GoxA family CTQ-dependent oxidase [Ilumatobacteraceae bacterium]
MAITEVKIHPAIGIARVGNSPTEFFIGPERRWDRAAPQGGYKDLQCRVKRQAARFRVFAYHDNGPPTEITAADGDISWTVHLANRKATAAGNVGPPADFIIDPGTRTLDGPDQQALFDTGTITLPAAPVTTVPLGEIRTDDDGRLLVLGGFGHSASPLGVPLNGFNPGWYDDTSDGPVTATVTIGADTFVATGAWVVVAPPKFAPPVDNVVSLWDMLFNQFVVQGTLTAPATPSYTNDIYPILNAANDAAGVRETAAGHHGFVHPVTDPAARLAIFNELKPIGSMPPLQNVGLTLTQRQMMELWKDGMFIDDWAGAPVPAATVTPDELDRAGLENAVGGSFDPGVEVNPMSVLAHFVAPFRLVESANVPAGQFTRNLMVPWQFDFYHCGNDWWPVPRPNQVMRAGAYAQWALPGVSSGSDMVQKWHTLGFVIRQGADLVEVDRCDLANAVVNLVTPALAFTDIAQGPLGTGRTVSRAAVFEVTSPVAVTLDVTSGPTDPSLTVTSVDPLVAGPTAVGEVLEARVRVAYSAPDATHSVLDSITVTCAETSQTWIIPIAANAVPRKVASVALVLDKSGSMNEDRGDGLGTKNQSLRDAAQVFVDVMLGGDKVSLVAFNQDAVLVEALTTLGDPADAADPGRVAVAAAIAGPGLDAGGSTSIGDGIHEGRLTLAGDPAAVAALVVLTDGKQNQPLWIADVAAEIDERTYAIGLGTAANTSAAELQALSGNNGGYLLVTGPITGDNAFVLEKHFLQILCGISSAEVVLDPSGVLVPGQEQRIPFSLAEGDRAVDVIVLTDEPSAVRFRIQTPGGQLIDPVVASQLDGVDFVVGSKVAYYRLTLPVEVRRGRPDHGGTWQAIVERPIDGGGDDDGGGRVRRRTPFSVVVHAWSDLAFTAAVRQDGLEPGAQAFITATLTDADVPVDSARVWAEVTSPAGDTSRVELARRDARWEGSATMPVAGTYSLRVRASGSSATGAAYQRERTMTTSVWHGGSTDVVRRPTDEAAALIGCLVEHVVSSKRLAELLRRSDVDVDAIMTCLRSRDRGRDE